MSDTPRTDKALKVLSNMKIPYGAWNDASFVSDFSRKLNSELDRNTPRTDQATYPADCLGRTLVVNRDCAAALERELAATQILLHESLIREDRFYRELAAQQQASK